MKRTLKDYTFILLKGIAMGAADVVPGVSGGTIAFISGIYEELLESISSVNFNTLSILKKDGFSTMWKSINGNFLFSLLLGIGISVVSLAKLISWLLETYPVLVWSFFFGLVLASILYIGKQIVKWNFLIVSALVFSASLAYWITTLQPLMSENSSPVFLFLAGALAICAMILPGISGAFILVLLDAYKPVLEAIHNYNIKNIAIIGAGAIIGLLSFSRILKWLFLHYKNITLAVLTGFIFGSLNKIWPWKKVIETKIIEGKTVILNEISISPFNYIGDNQIYFASFLALIGFLLILFLERLTIPKTA